MAIAHAPETARDSENTATWDHARLRAMFVGTGSYIVLYLLLVLTRLQFTGVLFLLLPFISSMLVASQVSRREHVMSTCFFSLFFNGLASFLVLGEGIICLLMASPIFAAMTWAGACIVRRSRFHENTDPPRHWTAVILVAALCGYAAYDAHVLAGGAPERTVSASYEIDAPHEAVWRACSFDKTPSAPMPWWLSTIPTPERYAFGANGAGAERWVDYGAPMHGDDADRPRGKIVYRVERWDDGRGATFVCVRNETRLGRWVDLIETRVDLEDLPVDTSAVATAGTSPRTKVTLTTCYRRRLGPDVYFNPLMDGAVEAMHAMLAGELHEGSR